MAMHWWRAAYGQCGFLNRPAEGPALLQFAVMPPTTSCILHKCSASPPEAATSPPSETTDHRFRFDTTFSLEVSAEDVSFRALYSGPNVD
jgi:hypothetical protein